MLDVQYRLTTAQSVARRAGQIYGWAQEREDQGNARSGRAVAEARPRGPHAQMFLRGLWGGWAERSAARRQRSVES